MRDAAKEKEEDNPFSYTAFVKKSSAPNLPPVDLFADVPVATPPPLRAAVRPML